MTGAGEHVRPLGPAGRLALVILPSPHGLSTPAVYREFDRLGVQRSAGELAELEARGGELPVHNDLQDAARSLCPPIDAALEAVAATGAEHVLVSGSGPTVFGLYPDLERGPRRRRGGRRDRGRAGRRGLRGGARGMKWGWLLTAVALAAFLWVRRKRLGRVELGAGVLATAGAVLVGTGVIDLPEHREADRGRRDEARPLDLPARRRAGLPRDGRLRRARRAGRDRGAGRRPRGRARARSTCWS